jgi:hypothetical protein
MRFVYPIIIDGRGTEKEVGGHEGCSLTGQEFLRHLMVLEVDLTRDYRKCWGNRLEVFLILVKDARKMKMLLNR